MQDLLSTNSSLTESREHRVTTEILPSDPSSGLFWLSLVVLLSFLFVSFQPSLPIPSLLHFASHILKNTNFKLSVGLGRIQGV